MASRQFLDAAESRTKPESGTGSWSVALLLLTAAKSPAAWAIVTLADSPRLRRGADEARPLLYLHPYKDTKYSSLALLELWFVTISARFSSDDLSEVDSSAAESLLDPQNVGIQVPHLAQALPSANATSGTRIGPDPQGCFDPKLFEQSLVTKALT